MVEVYPSSYAYSGVATIPEDSPIDDVSRVAAAAVAARALMGGNYASRPENGKATREEHAAMMHELSKKRAGWRTPRRGWSSTDKPVDVPVDEQPRISPTQAPQSTQHHHHHHHHAPIIRPPTEARTAVDARGPPRPRPAMPPPRRSYSVMDYEPPSATHRPSVRMTITDLPAELHFAVFDFLDPIDSTCLGLTNKHFYNIHRRMHGVVPLSSRREGPNDLEWAWRGAGPLVHPEAPPSEPALEKLRVKGQVYCRKCGISRCELHRHLKEWMMAGGRRYEYCAVTCKYGEPALDDAREFCYLKSPKKPHRCGRHAARAASGTQTPRAAEPQHKA